MRNDTPYSTALKKNAAGPTISNSLTPTMAPAPRPARVAASKRAEVLPRRTSLPAVAMAMNPRIEGTLAAPDAPSRIRVPPSSTRFVVTAVMRTATAPKTGP